MTAGGEGNELRSQMELMAELSELRKSLARAQRRLADKDRNLEYLVDAVIGAARDAQLAQPPIPRPPRVKIPKKGTSPHAGLLHTTDWQGGKVTADFNLDVLESRLSLMMDKTDVITRRHAHPVDEGVVLFGGDDIEGVNIFPTQPFEVNAGLYEQVFAVVRLKRMVIDRALAIWPRVRVYRKWGNHGRIGRFGELPDTDNLDLIADRIAMERYFNEPRVQWCTSLEYVQQFRIGNYHAALLHGNEFHKTFSAERIVRKVTAWQTIYGFGDVYMGHFHRRDTYGLPNSSMLYLTGSPESSNSYAADQLAAIGKPSQRLHYIDPERGRVQAEHILWLD